MQHVITVGDIIEWIINGAITVIFTTLVILALRNLVQQQRNKNGDL